MMVACGSPGQAVDCTILAEADHGAEIADELQEITQATEDGHIMRYKALRGRYEYLEAKCIEAHAAYTYPSREEEEEE
jgi:hypothetical protein